MKNKHLIIISHRRSGTHLTIDAVLNNFSFFKKKYLNLDQLRKDHKKNISLKKFKKELGKGPRVIKTHLYNNLEKFFNYDSEIFFFVKDLLKENKKIYVKRDGKKVLESLYFYMKSYLKNIKKITFSNFIRMKNDFDFKTDLNRIEFWKFHVDSWNKEKDILFVDFNDLINSYEKLLNNISNYLELPLQAEKKNIVQKGEAKRMSFLSDCLYLINKRYLKFFKGIEITSINLKNRDEKKPLFSSSDIDFYNKIINKND